MNQNGCGSEDSTGGVLCVGGIHHSILGRCRINLSANILSQVLMCIGYGPMLWSLFKDKTQH